jgi:hypothetical protein
VSKAVNLAVFGVDAGGQEDDWYGVTEFSSISGQQTPRAAKVLTGPD